VSLSDRFGHLVIDAEEHTERGLQVAGERARIHRVSTVLNLEGLDAENQMRRAAAFLGGLFEVARDHWYPMLVVVDEAQLFAPAVAGEVSDEAHKLSLDAMTNLMCRGRKRGLAGGGDRNPAAGEARQTHGSGPMWFATPSSRWTSTTYSLPVSRRTQRNSR
jgi:uncharacterized protein